MHVFLMVGWRRVVIVKKFPVLWTCPFPIALAKDSWVFQGLFFFFFLSDPADVSGLSFSSTHTRIYRKQGNSRNFAPYYSLSLRFLSQPPISLLLWSLMLVLCTVFMVFSYNEWEDYGEMCLLHFLWIEKSPLHYMF